MNRRYLFIIFCSITLGFQALLFTGPAMGSSLDTVVATVNDNIDIRKSQLDQAVREYQQRSPGRQISGEIKIKLVKNLVRRQLILQDDSLETLRNDPEIVKKVKQYEDSLVIKRFLEKNIGVKLKVSGEELEKYYKINRKKFSSSPKVEARHILLRTEKEAQRALTKLKDGEDFIKMAKEISIDLPMALQGGKMGIIEKGKTLPVLEKALFTLKEGEVSGVVKTRFGYHILKVDRYIPAGLKPFEEVKKEIRLTILRQKESKAFEEVTRRLEKDASIKIFEDRLNDDQKTDIAKKRER